MLSIDVAEVVPTDNLPEVVVANVVWPVATKFVVVTLVEETPEKTAKAVEEL